ncbi:hypothetical protein C8R47DRAFT_42396 [Mycena vitilis]|nr:hypothetical protein C8R47DRAFT_42396 [Mycena vitilis]
MFCDVFGFLGICRRERRVEEGEGDGKEEEERRDQKRRDETRWTARECPCVSRCRCGPTACEGVRAKSHARVDRGKKDRDRRRGGNGRGSAASVAKNMPMVWTEKIRFLEPSGRAYDALTRTIRLEEAPAPEPRRRVEEVGLERVEDAGDGAGRGRRERGVGLCDLVLGMVLIFVVIVRTLEPEYERRVDVAPEPGNGGTSVATGVCRTRRRAADAQRAGAEPAVARATRLEAAHQQEDAEQASLGRAGGEHCAQVTRAPAERQAKSAASGGGGALGRRRTTCGRARGGRSWRAGLSGGRRDGVGVDGCGRDLGCGSRARERAPQLGLQTAVARGRGRQERDAAEDGGGVGMQSDISFGVLSVLTMHNVGGLARTRRPGVDW